MSSRLLIIILSLFYFVTSWAGNQRWEAVASGIEYLRVPSPTISTHGRVHAFRVSLDDYSLDLAIAKDYGKTALLISKFAQHTAALLAINGGFFNPSYQPLGLRVQHKIARSDLKNVSWWGVFYIKKNHAYIVSQRHYSHNLLPEFAIQAGPRLLINGKIPKLKPGYAERSALCTSTHNKEVIMVVTEHAPLTTTQFAEILQRPVELGGIGCYQALNLDGGGSSQLYAQLPNFSLKVMSFQEVADAIIVEPKKS